MARWQSLPAALVFTLVYDWLKRKKGRLNISPYTPGQFAREIYERDKILEDFKRDLAFQIVEPHLIGRIEVCSRPRGVGKTSLLRSALCSVQRSWFLHDSYVKKLPPVWIRVSSFLDLNLLPWEEEHTVNGRIGSSACM